MVAKLKLTDLPEIKPTNDANMNQLLELRIRKIAKDNGLHLSNKTLCITGHVDSGKSGTTAAILNTVGSISDKKMKEEKDKIIAKHGESYEANMLQVATRAIEKGKEAKDRGMTFEVRAFEVPIKNWMYFDKSSPEYKEATGLMDELKIKYENETQDNKEFITYWTKIVLLDSPGHKDFIHNTTGAICAADVQFALFPNSKDEGGQDLFTASTSGNSTSFAHATLGISQGNTMVYLLSKCDTSNESELTNRMSVIMNNVPKSIGVKAESFFLVPTSSKDVVPHNVMVKSNLPELSFFKGATAKMRIKDYRDALKKPYDVENVKLEKALDVMHYVFPQICIKGNYENKGACIQITDIATKTSFGVVYCGQVLNGVVSEGDQLSCTRTPGALYKVESVQQFHQHTPDSPVKSFVGMRLSHSKKVPPPKVNELLFIDYMDDNKPQEVEYMDAKLFFLPIKKSTRNINLGAEFSMITTQRQTISLVRIDSTLTATGGKNAQTSTKATDDEPIDAITVDKRGLVVNCLIRFKGKVSLPTIHQTHYGHTGNFLINKDVGGSVKLLKHRPDGADFDRFAQMKSGGKKKAAK